MSEGLSARCAGLAQMMPSGWGLAAVPIPIGTEMHWWDGTRWVLYRWDGARFAVGPRPGRNPLG